MLVSEQLAFISDLKLSTKQKNLRSGGFLLHYIFL